MDNDRTRAVDFWVKTTMEGYVVKFAAESYQSFSKEEVVFSSGLREELIREVLMWIKMFMVEEGLLPLATTGMEA